MKQVLVVDDDPDIADALTAVLSGEFDVETASDGLQALERLEGRHFDAVVLDLLMPGLDGAGTLRAMRTRGMRVPVVLMSATPDLFDRARSLSVAGILAKPFDYRRLIALLQRLTTSTPESAGSLSAAAARQAT